MKQVTFSLVMLVFVFCSWHPATKIDKKQVLLKSIDKEYEGDTKKGLAHGLGKAKGESDFYEGEFKKGFPNGKGMYAWANGNIYTGLFRKGEMDGLGELIIKREENLPDSVLTGYFKDNEYIGKYKEAYSLNFSSGVRNVEFEKMDNSKNEIRLIFYSDGKRINPGLSVQDSKNTLMRDVGGYQTFVNVNFPLEKIKISFSHHPLNYSLDFSVFEQGSWTITVSV